MNKAISKKMADSTTRLVMFKFVHQKVGLKFYMRIIFTIMILILTEHYFFKLAHYLV